MTENHLQLKIAFVAPWFAMDIPGGAEASLRGIVRHLHEAGMDLEVLTTRVKEFAADWNEDYYPEGLSVEEGIPVRRFSVRKRDTAAFDRVNAKLMAGRRLSGHEEQIFVREMINSPELYRYIRGHAAEYSLFVYIPYMFGTTYHGILACPEKAVLIPCLHEESYAHLRLFRQAFSRVAGMAFHSRPEGELALSLYGPGADVSDAARGNASEAVSDNASEASGGSGAGMITRVIGTGIDDIREYDAGRFRAKYGISDPFILYAGRKDAGKNVDVLIRYFAEYRRRHSDVRERGADRADRSSCEDLRGSAGWGGGGDHAGSAGESARGDLKLVLIGGGRIDIPAGLQGHVIDLGFVPVQDKYDAYAAAELLCQPSSHESFSIVIMESWLCRRPVLVSGHCPVTKNFVIEAEGGLWFDDYEEFDAALTYIMEHPQTADAMAESGAAYVREHFTWDRVVESFSSFFTELILRRA